MRIFDPHIHMTSRTTDDYEAMYDAGVRALVEPAFWLGQPRTTVGSFIDYFDALIGWERFRAAQFGIRHHCTIALNPKEANDPRCREVMEHLPRYLVKDGVVAVGETGYDSMTPEEDDILSQHLALAIVGLSSIGMDSVPMMDGRGAGGQHRVDRAVLECGKLDRTANGSF